MKILRFLALALAALALAAWPLAFTGCATGRTEVVRETVSTNGVRTVERTFTRAGTFADGKNRLADFKAGQTSRSQTIGIGEQTSESTSDAFAQMGAGLALIGRLAAGFPPLTSAPLVVTQTVVRTNYVTVTNLGLPNLGK